MSQNPEEHFQKAGKPLEVAILATLLEQPGLITQTRDYIGVDDFVTEAARKVYRWLEARSKEEKDISPAVAMSHFSGSSDVEPYLMQLLSEFPDASSIKGNAEALRDVAIRRSLHKNARDIQLMTLKGDNLELALSKLSGGVSEASNRFNSDSGSIKSVSQISESWRQSFVERCESGAMPGISTGFNDLDDLTAGFQPADLIIVAGRPSMGKTTFAMNIIENYAIREKKAAIVFTLEMPSEALYQRMIASVGNVDYEKLKRGKLEIGDAEKVKVAMETLSKTKIFFEDQGNLSIDQMVSYTMKIAKDHDIGIIMVDYLQLMRMPKEFSSDRNNGLAEISRGMKQLAKMVHAPVIALSQLNRALEQRPNKRPVNADLRESGAIEQDADLILFVYRDEVYNSDTQDKGIAEIIIGKQRNGPLGTVKLGFSNGRSRFESLRGSSVNTIEQAIARLPDEGDLPARIDSFASYEHLIDYENPL